MSSSSSESELEGIPPSNPPSPTIPPSVSKFALRSEMAGSSALATLPSEEKEDKSGGSSSSDSDADDEGRALLRLVCRKCGAPSRDGFVLDAATDDGESDDEAACADHSTSRPAAHGTKGPGEKGKPAAKENGAVEPKARPPRAKAKMGKGKKDRASKKPPTPDPAAARPTTTHTASRKPRASGGSSATRTGCTSWWTRRTGSRRRTRRWAATSR